MGLWGLTTYIENRGREYFKKYELHDCNVVIVGGSLCKLINIDAFYWKKLGPNSLDPCCYNGNYDKCEQIFREFIQVLKECNIKPYFVYTGSKACEVKSERIEQRAERTTLITPDLVRERLANSRNKSTRGLIYPVGLQYTFLDVMSELNLNVITTHDADGDNVAAQLAKHLKCPLLGFDSDFFIYGSLYVPISSVNFNVLKNDSNWRRPYEDYKYLSCKMFRTERLLEELQDHNNNKHLRYVLPVLIGNDDNKQELFTKFLRSVNICGTRTEKISKIFEWLKCQDSIEQAIKVIINNFDTDEERCHIFTKICDVIKEYTTVSLSQVLLYFRLEAADFEEEQIVDFQKLSCSLALNIESNTLTEERAVSALFLEKYISCQYPSFFMKMLRINKYESISYVDDLTKPDANTVAYPIMRAIHKILVQDPTERLMIFQRSTMGSTPNVEIVMLPSYEKPLLSIEEISVLNQKTRREIMLEILEFGVDESKIFQQFPDEWHIFIMSLLYCRKNTHFDDRFIYALILNFIVLNYVDPKLNGFFRTKSHLQKKFTPPRLHYYATTSVMPQNNNEIFANMNETELKCYLYKIIHFFEMNPEDTAETFDRSIMHTLSEFNAVFLHNKHLNTLLEWPFKNGRLSKVYNGTFLYNITKHMKGMLNPKEFLDQFEDLSTVSLALDYICKLLKC